jgi:Fur family transcriptional regulator, ferric uptake regulator
VFVDLGLVERLDLPNGEHVYVTCQPSHHHHIICIACGRTTEVEDCGVGAVAREVGRRTGYAIQSHRLQLFAICPECQARPQAS